LVFAFGTFVSDGPDGDMAETAAAPVAATPTTPSIQRMRRFMFFPFAGVSLDAADPGDECAAHGQRLRERPVTKR
jgi:hypothetical protein